MVSLKEAKERLEELLREGEDFQVLLDDGLSVELKIKASEPKGRRGGFGSAKGWFSHMSEDFDEPLEDFKEYME